MSIVKTFIAKKNDKEQVIAVAKFVQDKRGIKNIDERYCQQYVGHGLTFSDIYKSFSSKEYGNNYYKSLISEGYVKSTESEFDVFYKELSRD